MRVPRACALLCVTACAGLSACTLASGLTGGSGGGSAGGSDAASGGGGGAAGAGQAGADAGTLSAYEQAVLADHPLAYYRLDEPSGDGTVHDSSGNGNDGMYVGGVTHGAAGALAGDKDPGVQLDGTSGRMVFGDHFAFADGSPFTLEGWFAPNSLSQNNIVLFSKMSNATQRDGYWVFANTSETSIEIWKAGAWQAGVPFAALTAGQYSYVAITRTSSTLTGYINGLPTASWSGSAVSLPVATSTQPFVVGAYSAQVAGFFGGSVDEVAVYGSALPAARILAHYRAAQ